MKSFFDHLIFFKNKCRTNPIFLKKPGSAEEIKIFLLCAFKGICMPRLTIEQAWEKVIGTI